jgi:glutaredoxin 3
VIQAKGVDGATARSFISAMSMELKLYSREWCSWCIDAKDYLSQRGYNFVEIDVGQDRQAYEEMKDLSDQTYVPTFVAGDKVLANFDTDQLEEFLHEHAIKP